MGNSPFFIIFVAVRMVLEKEAKVESTAIRQMKEEVKMLLEENTDKNR